MFRIHSIRLIFLLLLAAVLPSLIPAETPAPVRVADFLSRCRVLGEVRHGNLAILPVEAPSAASLDQLLTLDETVPAGRTVIGELDEGGSVNQLRVVNRSGRPVFILAGEILAGAKQNRILQTDVVVPAGDKGITVPAFCVEHGRWSYQGANFGTENNTAPISVRQKASQSQSQSEVWNEVSANNSTVEARSDTGSLSAAYKAPAVIQAREEYAAAFTGLLKNHPAATGVVVLIGDQVLVADLFASRRLFEKLWDKLLESYIVEAARRSREKAPSGVASAQEFLDLAREAAVETTSTAGAGRGFELKARRVSGQGLALEGAVVHLALFPITAEEPAGRSTPLQRQYPQINQAPH
jgi:hypothetical protein